MSQQNCPQCGIAIDTHPPDAHLGILATGIALGWKEGVHLSGEYPFDAGCRPADSDPDPPHRGGTYPYLIPGGGTVFYKGKVAGSSWSPELYDGLACTLLYALAPRFAVVVYSVRREAGTLWTVCLRQGVLASAAIATAGSIALATCRAVVKLDVTLLEKRVG